MQICHRCDNPKCINFDHIFLGTQSDNNLDKIFKGREKNVHGTAHYAAKLTEEDVMKMRSDNRTMEEIAKDYNVAPSTVNCVKLRQTWKHIA